VSKTCDLGSLPDSQTSTIAQPNDTLCTRESRLDDRNRKQSNYLELDQITRHEAASGIATGPSETAEGCSFPRHSTLCNRRSSRRMRREIEV